MPPIKKIPTLEELSIDILKERWAKYLECAYYKAKDRYQFSILELAIENVISEISVIPRALSCELRNKIYFLTKIKITKFENQDTYYYDAFEIMYNLKIHEEQTEIEYQHILPKLAYNLPKLRKVTTIKITGYTRDFKAKDILNPLCSCFSYMQNLKSISLNCFVTDEVLKVVGQYCKNLEKLIIMGGSEDCLYLVTDTCIPSLIECQKLKWFHLEIRTEITSRGFLELILGIPSLKIVNIFGFNFSLVLSNAARLKKDVNINITALIGTEIIDLNLIPTYCTKLTKLQIDCSYLQTDIGVLSSLPNLNYILLENAHIRFDGIYNLLRQKGKDILVLSLNCVRGIDYDEIAFIGKSCPNIKEFYLINCKYDVRSERNIHIYSKNQFKRLEYFSNVDTGVDQIFIKYILSNCFCIQKLSLTSLNSMNDDMIDSIIHVNPMSKLEILDLYFCDNITIKTVNTFIRCCPALRIIRGLRSCDKILNSDLIQLHKSIKQQNFDLRVTNDYFYLKSAMSLCI